MYFTHRFHMLLHLYVLHQFCSSICITSNFCSLKVIITVCNAFFQAYPSKTLEIICIECKYLNFSNHNLQLKSFILLIKQRTLKGIPWTSVLQAHNMNQNIFCCALTLPQSWRFCWLSESWILKLSFYSVAAEIWLTFIVTLIWDKNFNFIS